MKNWFLALMMVGLSVALTPFDAEARRFGGGKSSGMQRAAPPPPKPAAPAAAPNATPNAAAAATPKRSWMGPIAGLAAGLGLAALFSHLGLGDELANFVMIALLVAVAFFVIRMLMRRFAGPPMKPALAGAAPGATARTSFEAAPGAGAAATGASLNGIQIGSALAPAASAARLPADFDAEGFERIARMIFIRMQAANDAADLDDLRQFTTPELFASLRIDLQDRGASAQQTDVLRVDAKVLDFAQEDGRQIVSVRYQGEVREEAGAAPSAFDEVWHLVKPVDADGAWRIAGVQQPG